MARGLEYADYGNASTHRVRFALMKLDSDRRNGTDVFTNKFIGKVQTIFASLPKPKEWQSLLNNDLPLLTSIDEDVQATAVDAKLNKSRLKRGFDSARGEQPAIIFSERSQKTPFSGVPRTLGPRFPQEGPAFSLPGNHALVRYVRTLGIVVNSENPGFQLPVTRISPRRTRAVCLFHRFDFARALSTVRRVTPWRLAISFGARPAAASARMALARRWLSVRGQ